MKFKTTREDYDKAVKEVLEGNLLDSCCLLAQTISRVSGLPCRVGFSAATIKSVSGDILGVFDLPDYAQEAVEFFDGAFSVKPPPDKLLWRAAELNIYRVFNRDGFKEVEFDLNVESVLPTT